MRCLVTGGTGFVGSNLARRLIKEGHEVLITGRNNEQVVPGATFLQHNLNGISWDKVGDLDVVFHQAANNNPQDTNEREMFRANVGAGLWLLDNALNLCGCHQFVFASSTAVYGHLAAPHSEKDICLPLTPYAKSKLAFEEIATDFAVKNKVKLVGLRYCNVYGPGEEHKGKRASMIHQIINMVKEGKKPQLFKYGWQRRDWIYIDDVVEANLVAANFQSSGIFNCGSGSSITFNRVVELVNETMGTWIEPEYVDCPFHDTYQSHTECVMTRAKEVLGFVPRYSMEAGITLYTNQLKG